jgi:AraC-like DNA-binding protein
LTPTILQLGTLQAIFIAYILFERMENKMANRTLSILVMLLGILCFFKSIESVDTYVQFPHLIRLDFGISLVFGPMIFLYTKFLTGRREKLKTTDLWKFSPYLLNLIILFPFFLKDGESKIQILDYFTASLTHGTDQYAAYALFLIGVSALVGMGFCYSSLNVIKDYNQKIRSEFSEISKIRLDWLRTLVWSFMGLFMALLVIFILFLGDSYPDFDYQVYFFILSFVVIYLITYKALKQPEILLPLEESIDDKKSSVSPKLNNENRIMGKNLEKLMNDERPYLNSELTATHLAESISITRHQLSDILNLIFLKNFYEFINEYRVNEFKRMIDDPKYAHLTLLGIAYESGFNSKTSFNTAFKKITGVTPTQYKRQLLDN